MSRFPVGEFPSIVGLASVTINLLLMVVTAYYVWRVNTLRKTSDGLRTKIAELLSKQTSPVPASIQQTPTLELLARFITSASPILLALVGLASPYLKSWADTRAAAPESDKVKSALSEVLGAGLLDRLNGLPKVSHDGILGRELSIENEHVVNFTPSERTLLKVGESPTAIIDTIGPKKLTIQLSDQQDRVIVIPLPPK